MIAYITDLEGRWDKLERACAGNPAVSLREGALELAPGATLVFGGDAIDRGPAGRRIVAALLAAKHRYGERVVLLAGNRDINKLRLHRELAGYPPAAAPAEIRGDRPALLRWIFAHTMGAREAFAHRAAELQAEGRPADDEAVVDSFAADVAPGGMLAEYLASACLAYCAEGTLFLHGGVTGASLGVIPGREPVDDVMRWIDGLNAFYAEQLRAFAEQRMDGEIPGWAAIVAYQAPIPGTSANQASVVYGRLADAYNDPRLPEPSVVHRLQEAGIDRVVVGHTPVGDVPAVLRRDGFTLVMADNSYGRLECGVQLVLDRDYVRWSGRCRLDDGTELDVSAVVDERPSPVGAVTRHAGRLIKARLDDGWLLFRALPGRQVEQVQATDLGPLAPPASLG
ncbi:MAG TPA: metallophosphoesterase [Nannocystis sp.]